jgi:hypothetical protein
VNSPIRRRRARRSWTEAAGQSGVVEVAAVGPGGMVGEDVALASPGGDVELGLGEAAPPTAAGVVARRAVVLKLAGELADRGGARQPVLRRA